jgi:ribosomal protein L11 methyltransferase
MAVPRRWSRIELRIPGEAEDALLGRLGPECIGLETSALPDGTVRLDLYLESSDDAGSVTRGLEAVLRGLGIDPAGAGLATGTVEDGRWVERFQQGLRPIALGRGFVVVPGEEEPEDRGRSVIRLVPGQAFGTGEHPTTRLCARALEVRVARGQRWLDLGTGTGILAVVAVRCGAESVVARDVDPDAVEVASGVLASNGVRDRVDLALGSLEGLDGAALDGIVANIAAPFFLDRAPALGGALRPGGRILASGFLDVDLPDVREALEASGFRDVRSEMDGAWRLLDGTLAGGP